jgi:hypothetical protein
MAVNNLPISKRNKDFLSEITQSIFVLRRHSVVGISSRIFIVREEGELPRITEESGMHGLRQFRTCDYVYKGRFVMFTVITNIYNKKTTGPSLMELFTAAGKLKKFFLTTRDIRCVHHG